MEEIITLVNNLGFPMAVAGLLLWDKIKSNGHMAEVVKTNNEILCELKEVLIAIKKK